MPSVAMNLSTPQENHIFLGIVYMAPSVLNVRFIESADATIECKISSNFSLQLALMVAAPSNNVQIWTQLGRISKA